MTTRYGTDGKVIKETYPRMAFSLVYHARLNKLACPKKAGLYIFEILRRFFEEDDFYQSRYVGDTHTEPESTMLVKSVNDLLGV